MNQSFPSLRFIDKEGDFLELKIEEAIAFMGRMASKIISKGDMPIRAKIGIQETFQVFRHLQTILLQGELGIGLLLANLTQNCFENVVGAVQRP